MLFESFQSKKMQKSKNIGLTSAITKYGNYLKSFLVVPEDQTTFSTLTINYCCSFKERFKTLTFSIPINKHCYNLKKGFETLISSTPSNKYCRNLRKRLEIKISSAPTNNHYRNFKKGLKTQLVAITSILSVNDSNISEDISSSIDLIKMGCAFWHEYYWRFGIKNSTQTAYSLCKYI